MNLRAHESFLSGKASPIGILCGWEVPFEDCGPIFRGHQKQHIKPSPSREHFASFSVCKVEKILYNPPRKPVRVPLTFWSYSAANLRYFWTKSAV